MNYSKNIPISTTVPCPLYRVGTTEFPYSGAPPCPVRCRLCRSNRIQDVVLDSSDHVPASTTEPWCGMSWSTSAKDFEEFRGHLWVVNRDQSIPTNYIYVYDRDTRNGHHFTFTCTVSQSLTEFSAAVNSLNCIRLHRLRGSAGPLKLDDNEPPQGKNESILAFCLHSYALSLDIENEDNDFVYNEIMLYVKLLLCGKASVSDIYGAIPTQEKSLYWNRIKAARERELRLESDKYPDDEVLQADISLELFDLNLLETYLNEVILN